jgi:sterol 3beta-glucosyltransferase
MMTPGVPGSLVGEQYDAAFQEAGLKVLIFSFGTRGDIEPYAALAARLVAEGHKAVLAVPATYAYMVDGTGVEFVSMGSGMDEVMRDGMSGLAGPVDALRMVPRMTGAMRAALREQWEIAEKVAPSVVVAHPKALGGAHVAERLGVPFVASLPLPFLTPTAAFPIPFVAARLPARVNRLSYQFNRFTAVAYGGMINTFRTRILGLRRVSRVIDYLHAADGRPFPVLYPFSRHVVPVPLDYPASAHVTGYWLRPAGDDPWTPSPELASFLAGSGPVVYAGFGSMGFGRGAAARGKILLEALRLSGVRAVVARGWGGISLESSRGVLALTEVPHSWLFPRVTAVIHHGGSGTTAAGLGAGRPTLICPVLGDQPFWGNRVRALGAGPAPLALSRMTPGQLAERITELVTNQTFARNAAFIGERIRAEDGTGEAVRALQRIADAPER